MQLTARGPYFLSNAAPCKPRPTDGADGPTGGAETAENKPSMMDDIAARLARVQGRIRAAEERFHRPPGSVGWIAVSKGQPAAAIAAVAAAGQNRFGESYVQEALTKQEAPAGDGREWHFIGRLQSNKAKLIARRFAWVHSVDGIKAAAALHAQRPAGLPPLNVCIQVKVSGEAQKGGIEPAHAAALADAIDAMERLRLRGVMAIPAPSDDCAAQRRAFKLVYDTYRALQATRPALDTLSMGMSHDLEAAVAEGATLLRIGTALFGPRPAITTMTPLRAARPQR